MSCFTRLGALVALPSLALVAACGGGGAHPATGEPIVVTHDVFIPGEPVACVPATMGGPPAYVDTDERLKSAGGPDERYQLVIAGRAQRNARLGEVEPVIAACPKAKQK